MTPTIFLDIDGVLNNTPRCMKGPRIMPQQAENLISLVQASGARIVLTSSWRKWVAADSMTLTGLERLFYTHGIDASVDVLPGDYDAFEVGKRAEAIAAYVAANPGPYVVLDDKPIPIEHFVQTSGTVGLTCDNVMTAYRILRDTQR